MNARAALASLAIFAATPGCSQDPVVVAMITDSSVEASPPLACGALDGGSVTCPDGSFCSSTTCGSPETPGTCEPIPTRESCADAGFDPQCGCNGTTYFNDCLRKAAHIGRVGEYPFCPTPFPSGICNLNGLGSKCDAPLSCVAYDPVPATVTPKPSDCSAGQQFFPGTCWDLPDSCPSTSARQVRACGSPNCVDACGALKDGGVLFVACP